MTRPTLKDYLVMGSWALGFVIVPFGAEWIYQWIAA